jgi:enoyl-CoA hydratase/carnithine racemase
MTTSTVNPYIEANKMSNLNAKTDAFESQVVDGVAVVRLKDNVLEHLTKNLGAADAYLDFLKSVDESADICGFVQINDRNWDCRSDTDAFLELLTKEAERMSSSRWGSYQHEVLAARFRNSVGRILLEMIRFGKTAVAGMQGEISGDHLGSTLAFDFRIATADTTFSFENIRLGLPASAGITFLMPRYIGVGRAMSLVQKGATINAHEALSLGLVSEVIDSDDDLAERCREEILYIRKNSHRHLIAHHRQHILPSVSEVDVALERYYRAMVMSLNELRKRR